MKWPWQKAPAPFRAELPKAEGSESRLDQYSETWRFLKDHLESRLSQLRESNDSMVSDAIKTAVTRGRIAEIKDILDLPNPKPEYRQSDYGDGV